MKVVDAFGNENSLHVLLRNISAPGKVIAKFDAHTNHVTSVAFSPDSKILISGSFDGTIKLWDVAIRRSITTRSTGSVFSLALSPDGTMIAVGSYYLVSLWDVATGENITPVAWQIPDYVHSVVFSPDGAMIAIVSEVGVTLWDISNKNFDTLKGYTRRVNSVKYSPDGTILALGTGGDYETAASFLGGRIYLWKAPLWRNIATLEGHWAGALSVAFSPDGMILASGALDHTVRLWDVTTGANIATFEAHTEQVRSVAFSPDGTILASGAGDGKILLWDVSQYVTLVVNIPDANLRTVIRDALGKSRFAPITATDMASLTTLDASNRNIRDLTGLEFATNLIELNLVDNRLSSLSINTHIPALQDRGVEVLFDKTPTPDFDGDGTVGFADFLLFVAQFGFSEDDEGYDVWFDLDGDGMIGFGDFLIFANAFGKAVSSN